MTQSWDDFMGRGVDKMQDTEKDYFKLECRRAMEMIVNRYRSNGADFFMGLSMLLQEEARKRQVTEAAANG